MAGFLFVLWRSGIFFLLSSIAVGFPLILGKVLWPDGLSAGAQYIFWIASGVNVAGVLILGWRYAFVILLTAFPAIFLLGEPVGRSVLGATGNCLEALVAWWIIRVLARFEGGFARVRTVLALLLVAAVAPMANSLVVPVYLVLIGRFSISELWAAIGNWNMANGVAILVFAPFLVALYRGNWLILRHWREGLIWLIVGLIGGAWIFGEIFQTNSLNFAFIVFPFVILIAVRFGLSETAAALCIVIVTVYMGLIPHAAEMKAQTAPGIIWFVQALCWVLAATGLIVAALSAERREAEARTLELSLREERARLQALRYQINPHFLFNALNSIRASFPATASASHDMVTELAGYLRSTLDQSDEEIAPLREELRSIRQYLAIEKKRFGDDLVISFEIDQEIENRPVPFFLLQPLVENAIRHGFEVTKGRFELQVRAFSEEDWIMLEVRNTGHWRESVDDGRKHIGLENIRRRLRLLYAEEAGLTILREDGWVAVRINLPRERRSQ